MKKIMLFIGLTLLSLIPNLVQAVESALVSSEKAIVYAEDELLTPVGYLRRGKRILVGSNPLRKGLIYSIVLPGKIAYIQAKDLRIEKSDEDTKKVTEHNLAVLEGMEEEIYSINNHITPMMSQMDMGQEWSDLRGELGDTSNDNTMSYWRFLFEHRDPRFRLNWGLGMDFMGKELETLKFSAWGFEGNLNYSLIKSDLFSADVFGGVLGFPYVKTENSLALDSEQMGKMWGLQYGAQARLFPYSQWGLIAGMMYTTLSIEIADVITQQEIDDNTLPVYSKPLTKIGGWNFFIGFSYKL